MCLSDQDKPTLEFGFIRGSPLEEQKGRGTQKLEIFPLGCAKAN